MADMNVSLDIITGTVQDDAAAMFVRCSEEDGTDGWSFELDSANNLFRLLETTGASHVQRDSDTLTISSGTTYTVNGTLNDTSVSGTCNSASVSTTSSFRVDAECMGLRKYNDEVGQSSNRWKFDNYDATIIE